MLNDWSHKVWAILKKYCPGNIKKILPSSQSAWNTRFYFGHQKLCMDNNKKYCPPHKPRGIHDFISATKSSVWIIIFYIVSQEIYGYNGTIYQINIYKKMMTLNHGCVGATHKFTCSETVLASLLMFFIYVYNRTTITKY